MRTITRITTVCLTLFGCVGCDQASKSIVRLHLALGESHSYLLDTFRLVHAENFGAFLSIGETLPEGLRAFAFSWIVGLLSVAAGFAALFAPRIGRWQIVALALIAAGGLGNWINRMSNHGHVTDFLNIGIGLLRTGIFNIADISLTIGVVVFVLVPHAVSSNSRSNDDG